MLKWTASAFAMAAAMQLGLASAQEPEAGATISPPGPAVSDDAADNAQDAAEEARDVQKDAAQDTRENLQDARDDAQDARDDAAGGVQRQANFAPDGSNGQVNDHVRAATANLNIDDATRSRYRWHNGEWWFKTKSGNWKFYRDGQWQDFDPTTYRAMNSGSGYGPSAGNFVPQGDTSYVQPQQMSGSSGYYYQAHPYSVQRYSGYRGMYNNNGWNNNGWNNGYYNNGFNNGYYNNGYYNGGMGYNPGNDRYYGYGAYGQPYSISGDRYRGGMIGSQIGGRLGGNTGAIIGGAIGANAAD